jgi:hypothetical protein
VHIGPTVQAIRVVALWAIQLILVLYEGIATSWRRTPTHILHRVHGSRKRHVRPFLKLLLTQYIFEIIVKEGYVAVLLR